MHTCSPCKRVPPDRGINKWVTHRSANACARTSLTKATRPGKTRVSGDISIECATRERENWRTHSCHSYRRASSHHHMQPPTNHLVCIISLSSHVHATQLIIVSLVLEITRFSDAIRASTARRASIITRAVSFIQLL